MKRLYKQILKLQVDFLVTELKTLHKIKKLEEDLDKKHKKCQITSQLFDNQTVIRNLTLNKEKIL